MDFNGDGIVLAVDILYVVQRYQSTDLTADLNGDGVVTALDILIAAREYRVTCHR